MSRNLAFLWGYAHYAVFASVATLGAGLEVALESTHPGSGVSDSVPVGSPAAAAIRRSARRNAGGPVATILGSRGV
jgi:hypothetical protein